jgi:hypothetical protein
MNRIFPFTFASLLLTVFTAVQAQNTTLDYFSNDHAQPLQFGPECQILADEETFSVKLFSIADPALKLLISNQTQSPLVVSLTNSRQERLFESTRPGHQTWGRWRLDLSELPDGTYTLHIRAGKHEVNRPFVLETRKPVVYASDRTVAF